MYDVKIPMVYVEESHYGRADVYGRYVQMSFTDIICTVKDAEGLMPIQIRMPQDPDTYLIQDIFSAALAVEAAALVVFHNISHGNASLENDLIFYEKSKNAGDKIGIPLLDHIILNGGMISGISDTPIVAKRWKDLVSVGCRLSRQLFQQDGKCHYIMSAYLPGTMAGRKKPSTIGI